MHVHHLWNRLEYDPDLLGLYLANGVTTVRVMHGEPRHLEWRDQLRRGEMLGPTLIVSSPMGGGGRFASSKQDAVEAVQEYADQGYAISISRLA